MFGRSPRIREFYQNFGRIKWWMLITPEFGLNFLSLKPRTVFDKRYYTMFYSGTHFLPGREDCLIHKTELIPLTFMTY